jgi:hypothetical protein
LPSRKSSPGNDNFRLEGARIWFRHLLERGSTISDFTRVIEENTGISINNFAEELAPDDNTIDQR